MAQRRRVEVFSAGCMVCDEAVSLVQGLACDSCEVVVLDMADPGNAARARALGVRAVPAVAVDGRLAACCIGRGLDEATLRAAGLGHALG
ncbi:MAG: hypothetical protein WEF50_09625 [Myxococcota bacterium]